eukprot:CAMPEP_0181171476 /NCGR_PEP_ID=MMETSP1096-20121128/1929_1 /TAXON_ID=156174 ORGANISM="Chrysochromulina ericina, Strain CCMP281" /NCGR_SAMPLE_ID=MMETSP1096 /ASSEMBLY_ACC=CAM_ASM_000453 /LENGTH=78 /DNA_ID=CAMNT_0023259125 /DNA_START=294 /DNA_END=527 /DNA_ORIENTATION=+
MRDEEGGTNRNAGESGTVTSSSIARCSERHTISSLASGSSAAVASAIAAFASAELGRRPPPPSTSSAISMQAKRGSAC